MAQAVTITFKEFDTFITARKFQPIDVPGTNEIVYARSYTIDAEHYDKPVHLSLRVYSTIEDDVSRAAGDDAIRVAVYALQRNDTIIMLGITKRVHRVAGWRENLTKRLDNWQTDLIAMRCPQCQAPTVIRKPGRGQTWIAFYGCCRYPVCRGTLPYK